jgi:hypothetical protein
MARFRNFLQDKFGNKDQEQDPVEAEIKKHQKEEEDAANDEKRLKIVLEIIRQLYFQHKLTGTVEVGRSVRGFYSNVSCEVDGTGNDSEVPEDLAEEHFDQDQLSRFEKMVVAAANRSIDTMIHRARGYKHKSYRKDLTVTNSAYITDPFFGIFTLYISTAATCESLLTADSFRTLKKMEKST